MIIIILLVIIVIMVNIVIVIEFLPLFSPLPVLLLMNCFVLGEGQADWRPQLDFLSPYLQSIFDWQTQLTKSFPYQIIPFSLKKLN